MSQDEEPPVPHLESAVDRPVDAVVGGDDDDPVPPEVAERGQEGLGHLGAGRLGADESAVHGLVRQVAVRALLTSERK